MAGVVEGFFAMAVALCGTMPHATRFCRALIARLPGRAAPRPDADGPDGSRAPVAPNAAVIRMITALAGLAALVIAGAAPGTYFSAARFRLLGALEASARLHAMEVAELARANPAMWEFDGLRVSAPSTGRASAERRRVFDAGGRLIIESVPGESLDWPVLTHQEPILDGGQRLGAVEAARSLRDVIATTILVALASTALSGVLFVILRVLPLRLLHQALERASFLAAHDLLTGLPNRALFADRLAQAVAATRRGGEATAVFCLDLDRFKEVNDTHGHAAGDLLLQTVAARLAACLWRGETLARLGGDEFAVIQPRARQPGAAEALARRLVAALEQPIDVGGHLASVGVSVGIAVVEPGVEADLSQVMMDADLALYQAKENGRGGHCFFAPAMNHKLQERRSLAADLRIAVSRSEFHLVFQPQVSLGNGGLTGAEALLRWERPGLGNMPPDRFIGLAEETGLIGPIGDWVLREACRQASTWPDHLTVAVNVSPVQFRQGDLYATVTAALRDNVLAPRRLELEITEGVLLQDTDDTLAVLHRLRDLGVRIAMDDFGTGYSSLVYLQKFPFDKVKIDRSFVRHLGSDRNAEAIVRAVIGMSAALGVRVNAEGVETATQADLLRREGCQEVQGFLFGKPMPAPEFAAMFPDARIGRAAA